MTRNILLLFVFSLNLLSAQNFLESDFWLDAGFLGYLPWEMADWELPRPEDNYLEEDESRELYRLLLEDARYQISASIYGWKFRYQPADRANGVEEQYIIELAGEIPWGSDRMQITRSWQEDSRFYIHARYLMSETDRSRWESHLSNRYSDSGGRGEGAPFGENPRQAALEEALKESIRNYLRPRERRRPREISGRIFLREFPIFTLKPSSYACQVLVKLDLDPIVGYPLNP